MRERASADVLCKRFPWASAGQSLLAVARFAKLSHTVPFWPGSIWKRRLTENPAMPPYALTLSHEDAESVI